MDDQEQRNQRSQDRDPELNRPPGVVVVPGSPYAKMVSKFEQFPSKFTTSEDPPGNPYVYRHFPMMLYRAGKYEGKIAVFAQAADPLAFDKERDFARAEELATRFNRQNQTIVQDETEYQRMHEQGYREDPADAVAWAMAKDEDISRADAHREYEDRNMSDLAKAEVKALKDESGGEHVAEVPRTPARRRKKVAKKTAKRAAKKTRR